ncbi:cytochrome c maturation protein CcmE [Methylobacillus gramineus]|uniref:cytochrome c maturation protein CcmE n=1 Tax=Methylobacillus gramineus TaxID=755169 RepID=UPI001CFFCE47|nr:cytochrome c maturation protein CcmE [Methylobacillus gramineus]MCB5183621.1 cytochrome c maturation protein CcmE [Methylobacillus gramineus]
MKLRYKRASLIGAAIVAVALAVTLILSAFRSNIVFFYTPTQVANGEVPKDASFRIGGMVVEHSLERQPDGLTVHFVVTDTVKHIPVSYQGILPDLFKEGKGVVAQGVLDLEGRFIASNVLAKHDENYMPPEAAEALKRAKAAEATQTPGTAGSKS